MDVVDALLSRENDVGLGQDGHGGAQGLEVRTGLHGPSRRVGEDLGTERPQPESQLREA